MSQISKKPMTTTGLLVLLGMVALYAGPAWLIVLIPAASLVWYLSHPTLGNSRH